MKELSENALEQHVLTWFTELGYQRAHGSDIAPNGKTPEREDYRQVVLNTRLRAALQRLNPAIPAPALEDAARELLLPNIPSLEQTNRQVHQWLTRGVRVTYQQDNQSVGENARVIDFDNPANNDWLVVNQFRVQGAHDKRIPDVVVFVNGLPLVVVELKSPSAESADIVKAHNQLQNYKRDISDLFFYNLALVISDGIEAKLGSLTADLERFMAWRTIDGDETDPLGSTGELETLIRGFFQPALMLAYLRHFVLFEDDGAVIKKIAAYHQFHAVRKAVSTTIKASQANSDGRCGVVWHTQGSGKSITMTCYAAAVMTAREMHNPTIVVVTDRNDLDGQLFGVFTAGRDLLGETPVQANSREELRSLLAQRPSGGIIFTTIQKFSLSQDETRFPCLSERHNIVVIADEAHRSQYGLQAKLNEKTETYQYGYAQHLRDALSNAAFIAFTGTPVALEDRDTQAVFGDYIHVYDIEQAQKDKATVPIYYEGRLARLDLDKALMPMIDEAVEELTEDEEESAQAEIKRRWSALEKIAGTQPRLERIAEDLLEHFDNRQAALQGKGLIVCMSRDICARLYAEIIKRRPDWYNPNPSKGTIKVVMTGSSSDKPLLSQHVYSKPVKKDLEKRFKDPADPLQLVIVRDMWLTGFDVPCLHTMYIDKPMHGHNLMQAIARVNRVFREKPGGLVVDYIGIANELRQAVQTYTDSHGKGRPTVDTNEALAVMLEKLDIARGLLHGFDYSTFRQQPVALLAPATEHILAQKDGKKRFADTVLALSKAFALCSGMEEAIAYRDEVAFLQALKKLVSKNDGKSAVDDYKREEAMRQIVSRSVLAGEVVDIFSAAGLQRPDIGLLSEEFLAEVGQLQHRNLAVELLERLLKDQIHSRLANNLVQNKKFSDLLQATLLRYENRTIETAQVIETLIDMAKDLNQALKRGEQLGLSEEELAFYDALSTNEASVRELGEPVLKQIAQELTRQLRKNLKVDWAVRESVRAELRLMVKKLLKKYKYPPDQQAAAVATILQQAERVSEIWVG